MNHKMIKLKRYIAGQDNNNDNNSNNKHVWIATQYIEAIVETTTNNNKPVTIIHTMFGKNEYWVVETADEVRDKINKASMSITYSTGDKQV